MEKKKREENGECATWQQVYIGLAWTLGCATIGLLIVRQPSECRIGRQYLCQVRQFALYACLILLHILVLIYYLHPFRSIRLKRKKNLILDS